MRVHDIEVCEEGEGIALRAKVRCDAHWVWGDEAFPLWYRFPAAYGEYLSSANGDPFVPAFLAPAMLLNEPLVIEAEVSPKLLDSVDEIQTVLSCFEPRLCPIELAAPAASLRQADWRPCGARALFYSMGVDSSYSLHKNASRWGDGPGAITHLVPVEGFDVYLWESQRWPPMLARITEVADAYGKAVLPVTTNLRELTDRLVDWVVVYHGAALASVALALGELFEDACLAAAQTYQRIIPRGAHPLLDPLWGTETLNFGHDGLEADRLSKIRYLATAPVVLRNLRVCATGELTDAYNCGRCEKCLRTMIGLHVAGVLDRCDTLPNTFDLDLVRGIVCHNDVARASLAQLADALGDSPTDRSLSAALRDCLHRPTSDSMSAERPS